MNYHKELINPKHPVLSVRKQCDVLSVPRSSVYYQPIQEKPENIKMMHIMDKHLLMHPTEGVNLWFIYFVSLAIVLDPKGSDGYLR